MTGRRSALARLVSVASGLAAVAVVRPAAQVRLADESDRSSFRAWFVFLADAQFYRQTRDVTDCAGLVRHAFREALREHTPEWRRTAALPAPVAYPEVRSRPEGRANGWPLFRVSAASPPRLAEFADAHTIVRYNASLVGRDTAAARPGDLLYFHQSSPSSPDHLMVFVGPSVLEPGAGDWLVYHTGASPRGGERSADPGEVRKVRLADLVRHPSPRWRPLPSNPEFVGVFRLAILS